MATQIWQNLSVVYGEYDLACRAKTVNAPQVTVATKDATVLCNTSGYRDMIATIKSVSWSADVLQDHATGEVDDLLGISSGNWGSSTPLTILPAGIVDNSVAYTFRANHLNYTPVQADVNEIAMATLSGDARQGPVVRGRVLIPSAAYTTSTTGTARQLGAVATGQSLYAALHITAVSGSSPTLDAIVRSDNSGGMSSPTTQITFAQASTASWQWGSAAGPITDDYFDVDFTIGGSTPSFTALVVVGIA